MFFIAPIDHDGIYKVLFYKNKMVTEVLAA